MIKMVSLVAALGLPVEITTAREPHWRTIHVATGTRSALNNEVAFQRNLCFYRCPRPCSPRTLEVERSSPPVSGSLTRGQTRWPILPDDAYANKVATKATATHPTALVCAERKAPDHGRPTFHSTKGEFSPAQWTLPMTVGMRLGSLLNLIACSTKYLTSVLPNLKSTSVVHAGYIKGTGAPAEEQGVHIAPSVAGDRPVPAPAGNVVHDLLTVCIEDHLLPDGLGLAVGAGLLVFVEG